MKFEEMDWNISYKKSELFLIFFFKIDKIDFEIKISINKLWCFEFFKVIFKWVKFLSYNRWKVWWMLKCDKICNKMCLKYIMGKNVMEKLNNFSKNCFKLNWIVLFV